MRPWSLPVLAGVLLLVAWSVVACGGGDQADLSEVEDVVEELRANYIDRDRLTDEALNRAAIQGIIDYLDDPFTSFLSAEQFENFNESLSGEGESFGGIGAEVTLRNGQLMILAPLPDSPASKAGLRPGDIVLAVNGESVEGLPLLESVDLIRGPEGTTVVLRVLSPGDVQPREVSVVRSTIEVTSVSSRIEEPGVGYVRLSAFDGGTAEGLREAMERLRSEGARGLVLDLRNNSGGLVNAAVDVASEFIESGVVFIWRSGDGTDREFTATGEGSAYDIPLVVLVNGFSASASEIVAGALQDHERARLVGTRTFGKGSVNVLSALDSGSGLVVTTARWLTPKGRVIQGEGLVPDVVVGNNVDVRAAQRIGGLTRSLCEAFGEDRDAVSAREELVDALNGLCSLAVESPAPPATDEQLDAAVAELRKLMAR